MIQNSQKLIIPEKIEVGFKNIQNWVKDFRKWVPTGSILGFATYIDNKGVLRKEKSWNDWRDKAIEPKTFTNEPKTGFKIGNVNKRSTDWFGSGRHVWRVVDPRGFELEITSENLQAIIDQSDIASGEIKGELIWVWSSTGKMALIPVDSNDYIEATKFTKINASKAISSKDYGSGDQVITSKGDSVTFIGNFNVLTRTQRYEAGTTVSKIKYLKKTIIKRADGKFEYYPSFKVVQIIKTLGKSENVKNYKLHLDQFNEEQKHLNSARIKLIDSSYNTIHYQAYHFSEKIIEGVSLVMVDADRLLDVKPFINEVTSAKLKSNASPAFWLNIYSLDDIGRHMQVYASHSIIDNTTKLSCPHTNISDIKNDKTSIAYSDKRLRHSYSHNKKKECTAADKFYVPQIVIPGLTEFKLLA